MIKRFLTLEWKEFKRASYFQKGLAIKILLFLGVLYFGGMAIFIGVLMFFVLRKFIPGVDPPDRGDDQSVSEHVRWPCRNVSSV